MTYARRLIPKLVISQQLEPIWNLKWGTSLDTVIEILKVKKNIFPDSIKGFYPQLAKNDTSKSKAVFYNNQSFDGHTSFACILYFISDRFLHSEIWFNNHPKNDNNMFLLFDSIETTLKLKYFAPQFCNKAELYKSNREKVQAIDNGVTDYNCNWFFPKSDNSEKGGRITLQLRKHGHIILTYDYIKANRIHNSDF